MRGTVDLSSLLFDPEIEKLAKRTKKEAKLRKRQQQGQTPQEGTMVDKVHNTRDNGRQEMHIG